MAYYGPNGDIIGKVIDTKYYKLEFCWSWSLQVMHVELHLFSDLHAFWFLEKNMSHEICVSGTVLMTQLTQNSSTNTQYCL